MPANRSERILSLKSDTYLNVTRRKKNKICHTKPALFDARPDSHQPGATFFRHFYAMSNFYTDLEQSVSPESDELRL